MTITKELRINTAQELIEQEQREIILLEIRIKNEEFALEQLKDDGQRDKLTEEFQARVARYAKDISDHEETISVMERYIKDQK